MRAFIFNALLLVAPTLPAVETTATNPQEAVVLQDSAALNHADLDALMAVLSSELRIYKRPTEPFQLVGPLSDRMGTRDQARRYFTEAFKQGPQGRHEVLDMVSLGDLVLAHVEFQLPGKGATHQLLTGFHVRAGLIETIWHIAAQENAAADSGTAAAALMRQFNDAASRNDVDAVLALYSPQARNFHFKYAPETLGGGPSTTVTDSASRERIFRRLYTERPARRQLLDGFTVGDWAVNHDRATQADGSVSERLSLYRVHDGKIVEDWFLAEQRR